jgi:hypothetical protein
MTTAESGQRWRGPIAPPSPSELADIYAIQQLCRVYALGIDSRDLDLSLSVFAPDAQVAGMQGGAAVGEYLPKIYDGAAAFSATQHNMTNQYVDLRGDEATLWSYAICYHIEEDGNGREDLVVAVQYRDECRRTADGWVIASRRAVPQWTKGPLPAGASK